MSHVNSSELKFKITIVIWSHIMRKPVFAICEQQRRRSICTSIQSDQRLCYSLLSILPLVSSLLLVSVAEQAGLSLTWSETPKTGFLVTGSLYICIQADKTRKMYMLVSQIIVEWKRAWTSIKWAMSQEICMIYDKFSKTSENFRFWNTFRWFFWYLKFRPPSKTFKSLLFCKKKWC